VIESDGPGGAERVVALLAAGLRAGGSDDVVCLPADGEGWLGRELAASGVAVAPIPVFGTAPSRTVRALIRAFRRHRIEVVHSHEFTMAVLGAAAARWVGVPHVITMHGSRYYAGRLRRRLALRAAMALSRRVVTVSRGLAQQLARDLRLSHSRVRTIPNGVPPLPAGAPTLRAELGLGPAGSTPDSKEPGRASRSASSRTSAEARAMRCRAP
jgi:glycosyltransferase involved in cell wall biosynthesis